MSFLDDLPDQITDALADDFRDAILTRAGTPTGPSHDPTPGTPVDYACKALRDTWSGYDRVSGLVSVTDQKILILATTLATTPQLGDVIAIAGALPLRIASEGGGQPGVSTDPAGAVWVIRCS